MRYPRVITRTALQTCSLLALAAMLGWFDAVAEIAGLDDSAPQEEIEKWVEDYNRRLFADPGQARLYVKRGNAYFRLHEFDKAIEDFDAAIRLDAGLDEAYFGRGMALGRAGEIDQAIADLGVYIARNPKSSVAYTKRGVRYLWKGDVANAEKDLARAITLDPDNAEAHDDLGVIHAQRGEYAKAAGHFSTTIRLDPSYQKAYHNLAMVQYLSDREERALMVVEQGLKLRPDNRSSLLLKAQILDALGRRAEAKAVRDYAELLPESGWSERMPIQ